MATDFTREIAGQFGTLAIRAENNATQYDDLATRYREFAGLLHEAARRLAKGDALDAVALLDVAFPPAPFGGAPLVDQIAALRRALGKDALAAAIGRLP